MNQTLSRKAVLGLVFMIVAGLGWGIAIAVPILPVPRKTILFPVAISIAESSFLIGLVLLGKSYWRHIRSRLIKHLHRSSK